MKLVSRKALALIMFLFVVSSTTFHSANAAKCTYTIYNTEETVRLFVAENSSRDGYIEVPKKYLPLVDGMNVQWESDGDRYTLTYKNGRLVHALETLYERYKTVLKTDKNLTAYSGFIQKVRVMLFFHTLVSCED